MKVVFVSNYLSHHQKPLCNALAARTEFAFLQTERMSSERLAMGWQQDYPAYVTEDTSALAEADVVIAGSAPERLIRPCILQGKLVFRYHERPLKDGNPWWKRAVRYGKWHWQDPRGANVWLLCAGGYVAADYARFGLFRGRALKWGYFPEAGMPAQKEQGMLLWAGRLVSWKHPEAAVAVAAKLKAEGYDFHLDVLGTGPMAQALREQIARAGLQEQVRLCGAMAPEKVRERMGAAAIYLFTSGREEGWGAVLSEAMSCGCAVVASCEAGATPYLVRHGYNGLCYETEEELYRQVKYLLDDSKMGAELGREARKTVAEVWNGEVAARRLVAFSEKILAGEEPQFWPDGPCSKA